MAKIIFLFSQNDINFFRSSLDIFFAIGLSGIGRKTIAVFESTIEKISLTIEVSLRSYLIIFFLFEINRHKLHIEQKRVEKTIFE